ncbi:MAG: twin-arginine translocation signal domain-containing protein [Eggerthellaceae bacterium]
MAYKSFFSHPHGQTYSAPRAGRDARTVTGRGLSGNLTRRDLLKGLGLGSVVLASGGALALARPTRTRPGRSKNLVAR